MDADKFRATLKAYLTGTLPLEAAAMQFARWAVDEEWYLYHNRGRGRAEELARLEALERRVNELVATDRGADGDGPSRGTA